jgi:hypothetical protein
MIGFALMTSGAGLAGGKLTRKAWEVCDATVNRFPRFKITKAKRLNTWQARNYPP